ncbi:hypothetical protein ACP70R_028434 [Stipagrostis hirtigluma subsp. patula]
MEDGTTLAGGGGGAGSDAPRSQAAAAATAAGTVAGGKVEEEVDDEQVERFYALLANIRAMRGVYGAGGETIDGGGGGGPRKRARQAEPPWRPAFRLEDFEEPPCPATDADRCPKPWKQRNEADGKESGARPAAVASPSPATRI